MTVPEAPRKRLEFFSEYLTGDVLPFFEKYTLDAESGAMKNHVADDGTRLSDEFFMWSQLRAIWVYSALYNRIEKRPEWLAVARGLVSFCLDHGRDEAGRWCYYLSDGFAVYGLAEYYRATGDERALDAALATYESIQERLAVPGSYGTEPYAIPPGAKAHAISMIFSIAFDELGDAADRDDIRRAALYHAREVMGAFLRPETGLVLEYVALDNRPIPGGMGRVVVPGHAIESMWFMIHIFRLRGDAEAIGTALECIRRHLEFGWDDVFGGIFLGADAEGKHPVWPNWEAKLWWPHTEALYALTLAKEFSDAPWIDKWYRKVHEYAFSHFPVPEYGNWTQWLDRRGRKLDRAVTARVKDPLHLARALVLAVESLTRQIE